MTRRFTISLALCFLLFLALNALRTLSGPPAKTGVSGRLITGVPFPVRIQNIQYTAAGPVVTVIRDQPWIWGVNIGLWLVLSYSFSRWVERKGGVFPHCFPSNQSTNSL